MLGGGLLNKRNSLKLQKFKENNSKRKIIVIMMIFSILVLSGIYLYKTYALFTEERHFNVINGSVQDPGDIYFAYYVDNNITREMPKKGSGYTLDTEKSNCTNGVVPTWDNGGWKFIGDYSGYNAIDYTRTRCNLYFKKIDITAVEYIKDLAKYDIETIATDESGGNIRYIGSNPNNYVSVDGELWRIIGVMKDIDDGTGLKEDRIKLLRANSIGKYSWDTSDSLVNSGYGVNEWSGADLMKLLNPGYESESVGGSLYWSSGAGTCYNNLNNGTTSCNFTSIGMKNKLKALISDAVWNTGTNDAKTYTNKNISTPKFYEFERSKNTGKICSSSSLCNDTVERTTTWKGKVGLMYVSDYGYATSGGSTTARGTCLNKELYNWADYPDCYLNNWLYNSVNWQWTLSILEFFSDAFREFIISPDGYVNASSDGFFSNDVNPSVYLLSSVKIVSGDGSKSNPYTLSEN